MGRKGRGTVKKVFGTTEEGLPDTPRKISNVQLSRIEHGAERGCSFCFPHGSETTNSTARKKRRSWKHHRKTKFRTKKSSRDAEQGVVADLQPDRC
jgi:hypothetical protein